MWSSPYGRTVSWCFKILGTKQCVPRAQVPLARADGHTPPPPSTWASSDCHVLGLGRPGLRGPHQPASVGSQARGCPDSPSSRHWVSSVEGEMSGRREPSLVSALPASAPCAPVSASLACLSRCPWRWPWGRGLPPRVGGDRLRVGEMTCLAVSARCPLPPVPTEHLLPSAGPLGFP